MSKSRFVSTFALFSLLVVSLVGARAAVAAKPEDVFKGKIIITKNRLPMRFSSPGAFVAALQKSKTVILKNDEYDVFGDGTVTIHVRDHGPGLSEQERQRAFDRFWQSGATPTGTSGLGLAIVRQLAATNEGTITLEAPNGSGLDAVLTIPSAE